ncbi:hypothetical protein HUK80_07780 [Flavobacterium sp. MAH-1]|uniref:Uncharacterized protein n=1 Tax=Flavobacterium agri TaxID=2743471 RepID=A0A7Y8Y1F0_9FLAO|nr:hypothetical protein [Flavobacterium agri]NUY80787.1 hypothetical protein [Flavobacterium agri]NYA70811.1 hypothetical protein [Flavobacterium agri]
MKTYTISKEGIRAAAKREALTKFYIGMGVFAFFSLLLLVIAPGSIKVIAVFPLVFGLLIMGLVSAISMPQIENRLESTLFQIADDHVARGLNDATINGMNKFGMKAAQMRYGAADFNQFISVDNIQSTVIGKNGITITSVDENVFSGSGKIVIPKETDDYEAIKAYFIENAKKYYVQ